MSSGIIERHGPTFVAAAALGTLLLLYFGQLWAGAVLLPTDMLFERAFFRPAAPAGFSQASNSLLSDVTLKFFPWRLAVWESLRAWRLPFWNPLIFCGAPLMANSESAVFYPLNLVTLPWDPQHGVGVAAMLRLALAGGGMFAFLRALNLYAASALLGAIAFLLSGSSIVWLQYPVSNVYVCLPLLCWAVERWIGSRDPLYLALLAAGTAMQLLGGHPQTSLIVSLIVAAYAGFRIRCLAQGRRRAAAAIAGALLAGIAAAAIHLLPFLHWLRDTAEWQLRTQERGAALIHPGWWKELVSTPILFILPNFFGHPRWWPESFFYGNYVELTVYVGIVPLLFALLALHGCAASARRENTALDWAPARFFGALAIVSILLALRVPGIDLVNHLPGFNVLSPGRYRLAVTFGLAVLGGFGFDRFLKDSSDAAWRPLLRRLVVALALVQLTVLLIAYIVLATAEPSLTQFNRLRLAYPVMLRVFTPGFWGMYLPLAVTLFVLAFVVRPGAARAPLGAMVAAVLATAGDLFLFGHGFNPTTARTAVFPATPAADFLAAQARQPVADRVVALADDLPPNAGMPYRLQEIAGSDFPSARYLALMQSFGAQVMPRHNRLRFETVSQRLLDLLNVRYIITRDVPQGAEAWRRAYGDGEVMILENPTPLPRVSILHRATALSDPPLVLERLHSPSFDPRTELLIEDTADRVSPPLDPAAAESVTIRRYESNRVSLNALLTAPGFVYLADAYATGWTAAVDGRPARLHRANYAFRAVHVPAGSHEIVLSYRAPGFALGLAISAVGGLFVAGSALAGLRFRQRTTRRASSVHPS